MVHPQGRGLVIGLEKRKLARKTEKKMYHADLPVWGLDPVLNGSAGLCPPQTPNPERNHGPVREGTKVRNRTVATLIASVHSTTRVTMPRGFLPIKRLDVFRPSIAPLSPLVRNQ